MNCFLTIKEEATQRIWSIAIKHRSCSDVHVSRISTRLYLRLIEILPSRVSQPMHGFPRTLDGSKCFCRPLSSRETSPRCSVDLSTDAQTMGAVPRLQTSLKHGPGINSKQKSLHHRQAFHQGAICFAGRPHP